MELLLDVYVQESGYVSSTIPHGQTPLTHLFVLNAMADPVVECVPNFSEGRRMDVVEVSCVNKFIAIDHR